MKRFSALLLAALMAFSLTACGQPAPPTGDSSGSLSDGDSTTAPTANPAPPSPSAPADPKPSPSAEPDPSPSTQPEPSQPAEEIVSGTYYYYDWEYNVTTQTLTIFAEGDLPEDDYHDGSVYPPPWRDPYYDEVKTLVLSEGITSIGSYSFYRMYDLEKVVLPSTLTAIHDRAFEGCSHLADAVLPEGLTYLDLDAFRGCWALESLVLPESLIHVGPLREQSELETLKTTVKDGITYLGSKDNPYFAAVAVADDLAVVAFDPATEIIASNLCGYSKVVTDVIIPEGVRHIGAYSFGNCKNLSGVVLPEGVLTVGTDAFQPYGSGLSISVPSSVEKLEVNFYKMASVEKDGMKYVGNDENPYLVAVAPVDSRAESITLAEGVKIIASGCFGSCHNLTELVIPEGVTYIGTQAFYNCSKLKTVSLPASLTAIGDLLFYDSTALESVTVAEGNPHFFSAGDAIVYRPDMSLVWCGSSGIVPEGVEILPESIFSYRTDISTVTLPESLRSVGRYAFSNSSVVSVNIPNAVTLLPDSVFERCEQLTRVTLSANLRYIGLSAFQKCSQLEAVDLPDTLQRLGSDAFNACYALKDVVLPDSLRLTGSAFRFCNSLESIVIPAGIKWDTNALCTNCPSLKTVTLLGRDLPFSIVCPFSQYVSTTVTDVYYPNGTVADWQAQEAEGGLSGISATIHCSDGDYTPSGT